MKNIILCTLILISVSCKAQIKDIIRTEMAQTGVYYKDLNNVLDPFVGTYVYTSGSTTFTIELRKMIHSNVNNVYYEDMLIGAYRYVENGTLNADTFDNLNNNNFTDGNNYYLRAPIVFKGDWPGCDDCSTDPNNIWIRGSLRSVTNIAFNEIRFKRITHNGQPALKVLIRAGGATAKREGDPIPVRQPSSYPCCTEFTMIKQ